MFHPRDGFYDQPVKLPCGQCIGCRLERSRQWAIRCSHEASLYDLNCFITLTYSDEHLPANRSLDYEAPVLFMKRLRERFGSGIRSYGCAEYGEKFGRPHYHLCLFNFDFPDKRLWRNDRGHKLYTSEALSELWRFGFSSVGSVTFESAAYVARYVTKKVTGKLEEGHYGDRKPERSICVSRRPGIGKGWFDKFGKDAYTRDFVILRGRKCRPPKYYDSQFEIAYPSDFCLIKRKRKRSAMIAAAKEAAEYSRAFALNPAVSHPQWVKEHLQDLKFQQLVRGYELGKT